MNLVYLDPDIIKRYTTTPGINMEELVKYALTSLTSTGAAFVVFRWLGKKWIETQFSKKLEEFKRKQSELLEHYKFEINSKFNRITKIHEKEFEVLPKAWHKLQDATGHFMHLSSPLQRWPDLNVFTEGQLEDFLEKCELHDFQKKEILTQADKTSYYSDAVYWIRATNAGNAFGEFQNYIQYNKIFLSQDLFKAFDEIRSLLIRVFQQIRNPRNGPWTPGLEAYDLLSEDLPELMSGLESMVQERLNFDIS